MVRSETNQDEIMPAPTMPQRISGEAVIEPMAVREGSLGELFSGFKGFRTVQLYRLDAICSRYVVACFLYQHRYHSRGLTSKSTIPEAG